MNRDYVGSLVRIDGNLDAPKYEEILATDMLSMARDRCPPNWLFMQDNDPKHTSNRMLGKRVKLADGRFVRLPGWFSLNGVKLLKAPPYSADMNPIEHLWAQIKYRLRGRRFKTRDELWTEVKNEWEAIPLDRVIDLIDSMPRRIRAVIAAKGGPTKY
jgi:hypothetical protein